jgi:hypothetical protein
VGVGFFRFLVFRRREENLVLASVALECACALVVVEHVLVYVFIHMYVCMYVCLHSLYGIKYVYIYN